MVKNISLLLACTMLSVMLVGACGKKGPLEAPQKPQAAQNPQSTNPAPAPPSLKN
jgi:predicted small lipoprotein YifL